MDLLKHLPSPIASTFSEGMRIDTRGGSWIFISGQVGVPLPPDKGGSVTFEQEVRTTFERIRDSLGKLGAGMNHVVSIKAYLTDLGPYAVFSRIRGEFFPKDPPTSTAVQVAGLLLNAKIEIDAVAFLPDGPAA
jgi:2-iminobutanoate/2-iminopropanoate deaminase